MPSNYSGHENRLEPDYVNQDEIDRVGANTTHHSAHRSDSRTQSRNAGNLHVVTTPSGGSSRSAPSSPTHGSDEKSTGRDPSMSPRAQVQTVHSQVGENYLPFLGVTSPPRK